MQQKLLFLFFGLLLSFHVQSQVANQPADLVICDGDGINDGIAVFDLTVLDAEILNGQSPVDYILSYHESQSGANANEDVIADSSAYVNPINPQTIYARVEDASNSSNYDTTSFNIVVNPTPPIYLQSNYILCTGGSVTLNPGLSPTLYSFSWTFNGASLPVSGSGNAYTATEAGVYGLEIMDIQNGCTSFKM